jgi:hypothetical protein
LQRISNANANANNYAERNNHADANSNSNTNSHADGHTNGDGACTKAFTHTAASSDPATSPIAEKQVVTDVKWLGARQKSREFPSWGGKRFEYWPQKKGGLPPLNRHFIVPGTCSAWSCSP